MKSAQLSLLGLTYSVGLVGSIYVTWICAKFALGRWPRPYLDDPKSIEIIGIPCLIAQLILLLLPIISGVLVFSPVYAWVRASPDRKARTLHAFVGLAFIAVAIAALRWDPLRVTEWFFD